MVVDDDDCSLFCGIGRCGVSGWTSGMDGNWELNVLVPTGTSAFSDPAALVTTPSMSTEKREGKECNALIRSFTPRAAMSRMGYTTVSSEWPS